jgi:hypothetical protein
MLAPVKIVSRGDASLALSNATWSASLDGDVLRLGRASIEPRAIIVQSGREISIAAEATEVVTEDDALVRVITTGSSPEGHRLRCTFDFHQTEHIHLYVRLELAEGAAVDAVELPQLRVEGLRQLESAAGTVALDGDGALPLSESWLQLRGEEVVGVGMTKLPWYARWNDIGATGYFSLGNTRLHVSDGLVSFRGDGPLEAVPGSTIEASIFFRPVDESVEDLRYHATHDDPQENLYIPQVEWEQFLPRQSEDLWLGPPIFGGCINRPADQLIPRTLGMDILHRRRFSWNNEDLSLWLTTMSRSSRERSLQPSRSASGSSLTSVSRRSALRDDRSPEPGFARSTSSAKGANRLGAASGSGPNPTTSVV